MPKVTKAAVVTIRYADADGDGDAQEALVCISTDGKTIDFSVLNTPTGEAPFLYFEIHEDALKGALDIISEKKAPDEGAL